MRLLDDLQVRERHPADEREPEVPHEELGDLRFVDVGSWKVEAEALGVQRSPVHELDFGVEVGAVLRHVVSP
jgi:hypothetical protein